MAQSNDLLVVAPATANILAEFAHGLAGGFLSTLYLAFRGPVILAPAMNTNMWEHEATRANMETLRRRGHVIVEPGSGMLACGTFGAGRLAENEAILDAVRRVVNPWRARSGRRDDSDYGGADAGADRSGAIYFQPIERQDGLCAGAGGVGSWGSVILVSGPVALDAPRGAEMVRVQTATEMREAVFSSWKLRPSVIKCAAVADFRPAVPAKQKIKKKGAPVSLNSIR